MDKNTFLSKTNKYNIPGYTTTEFETEYKKVYPNDIEKKHLCKCPICGYNYLFNDGCMVCGYDDYLFFGDTTPEYENKIQKFKEGYEQKSKLVKNYIWKFDRYK